MTEPLNASDAVKREFGLYYLADELPHPLPQGLSSYYEGSARRLRAAVGDVGVRSLTDLLRAMRENPTHPVVRAIEDDTHFEWTEDQDTWSAFRQLIDGITAHLR